MLTIKITLYEIFNGLQTWINKTLNADLELFDTNYTEFYVYPKKTDLYIKEKKGKKIIYKKVDHFINTDCYNSNMTISLADRTECREIISLDCEMHIEEDYHKYRVYNTDDTPANGSTDYFECDTREKAIKLSKKLNKLDNTTKWAWA